MFRFFIVLFLPLIAEKPDGQYILSNVQAKERHDVIGALNVGKISLHCTQYLQKLVLDYSASFQNVTSFRF